MFAPAKVNLFLHVTGRRADGYHLLDSLAVFPAVGDFLSVAPADMLFLDNTGPFGAALAAGEENLVLRAARLLKPDGGARLTLQKNLPVASGIGGGSADAAAALRLLSRHWGVQAPLPDLALQLGADVPVCLASAPARMSGIGDLLLRPPILPKFGILLCNPGVAVSTAEVFRARNKKTFSPPAELPDVWPSAAAMADTLSSMRNDLEAPAIGIAPVIGDVLAALGTLPGCLLARMSGSGATCFALFETPAAAINAAARLRAPWWYWAGGLYEPAPRTL
jgi:4-diphosphocytidyl-2-C-methyl-D-erythritol kinase